MKPSRTKRASVMKLRTAIDRNRDQGAFPALVLSADNHDYAVFASMGVMELDDLIDIAKGALEGSPTMAADKADTIDLPLLGHQVPVLRRLVEVLALYDPADPRLDGTVGLLYLQRSSNYRRIRLSICVRGDFGTYEQVPLSDMPLPIVTPSEFVEACGAAIDGGHVSMPLRTVTDGKIARCVASQRSHLCQYQLDITVRGVTRALRLDLGMALVKRAESIPTDAYGDTIVGATCLVTGKNTKYWMVTYALPDGNQVSRFDKANIDHVMPQSLGGRTRLCNLQAMRASENTKKSSDIRADVSGEPIRSAKVVMRLARGIGIARKGGLMEEDVFRSLNAICKKEMSACAEFVMGGKGLRRKPDASDRKLIDAVRGAVSDSFGAISIASVRLRRM